MGTPDYNSWLGLFWGSGVEGFGILPFLTYAANVAVGSNPPYFPADFFALCPKFAGPQTSFAATTDGVTGVLTGVPQAAFAGLATGQVIVGAGIPDGSLIAGLTPPVNPSVVGSITISENTTAAATIQATVYTAPLVPLPILNAYIYLASNSIFQVRYFESWQLAMELFIEHYVTLWAQSQSSTPNLTIQQAAQSGLALGFRVAKSAGDVSVSYQPILFEDWGTFNLTLAGQQFIMMAQVAGMGGMLVY